MHARLRSRRSIAPRAVAEVYSALVVVAVTLALSYVAYAQARFPVSAQPTYVASSYVIYGSPSMFLLRVNSSEPSSVVELSLDSASSLSGVLELRDSGYDTTDSLCSQSVTTFFSVYTGAGTLSVEDNGLTWIDGNSSDALPVLQGWHEVIISNASSCTVKLPGGQALEYPSDLLSTIPLQQPIPQSFVFIIPCSTFGHTVTLSFNEGSETYGF